MTFEDGANNNAAPDPLHDLRVPADRSGRSDVPALRNGSATAEVAQRFDDFCAAARDRITGVGADQYSDGDGQRYERVPLESLYGEALEELLDVAAYAFMLADRIGRARDRFLSGSYAAD